MTSLLKPKSFLNLFPAPEFLMLSTAGISITDESIRFVQLRRKIFGGGLKLASSSNTKNPEGAIVGGLIVDSSALTPVLKGLTSRYGMRYTHATLPEEKSYLFTTSIGRVPPEGLVDAVAFIIEENAPVSLADSVFDFEIIGDDETSAEIKLAVSVLPKSVVNSYIQLFESVGISPVSLDLESRTIARAIIGRGDKGLYLIVNLALKKTGFYVVEDEVVQFSATSAYGVGEDDSFSSLNDIKSEMHKVIAFWNARTDKSGNKGKSIEKAILSGLGASKKDFVEKLMIESGIQFSLANVWLNTSSGSSVSKIPLGESLLYASAVGLVLAP